MKLTPNSPCVKICRMDSESGFCIGCFRTLEEIIMWGKLTDPEKDRVYDQLEKRRTVFRRAE